ncbi:MAG: winged helix DNA-binding protein, partial [Oscillibacter sp.]|nr:winged helix DNA-binding protein [Oscillibacter sp.]
LLHISPAAVANSLKSLERGGYVRRQPSVGDARRNVVILTEKGSAAVQNCHKTFERISQRMLEDFSEEEKEQLLSFRRRMLHNLCQYTPGKEEA